jgi:hypothetical protein
LVAAAVSLCLLGIGCRDDESDPSDDELVRLDVPVFTFDEGKLPRAVYEIDANGEGEILLEGSDSPLAYKVPSNALENLKEDLRALDFGSLEQTPAGNRTATLTYGDEEATFVDSVSLKEPVDHAAARFVAVANQIRSLGRASADLDRLEEKAEQGLADLRNRLGNTSDEGPTCQQALRMLQGESDEQFRESVLKRVRPDQQPCP